MKKLLFLGLVFAFLFVLAGCDPADGGKNVDDNQTTTASVLNDHAPAVLSEMETMGYEFDQRDASSIDYYTQHTVNEAYDIDISIQSLYLGYVDSTTRWAEVIGFSSSEDAQTYYNAVTTQDSSGMYVWLEQNVVVITYSQDTYDALN